MLKMMGSIAVSSAADGMLSLSAPSCSVVTELEALSSGLGENLALGGPMSFAGI